MQAEEVPMTKNSSVSLNCDRRDKILIGVDEAGRGPLLGPVHAASAILPKDINILNINDDNMDTEVDFDYGLLKDSKKFSSKKKLYEVFEYVKENSFMYSIVDMSEEVIDKINIREATFRAMQKSISNVILECIKKYPELTPYDFHVMIDGNAFKPMTIFYNDTLYPISFETIVSGDAIHKNIMAASILAKSERDRYIMDLCECHPELDERYKILKNKGYGTKDHIEGIKSYGYSEYHRKTFKLKSLQS